MEQYFAHAVPLNLTLRAFLKLTGARLRRDRCVVVTVV